VSLLRKCNSTVRNLLRRISDVSIMASWKSSHRLYPVVMSYVVYDKLPVRGLEMAAVCCSEGERSI